MKGGLPCPFVSDTRNMFTLVLLILTLNCTVSESLDACLPVFIKQLSIFMIRVVYSINWPLSVCSSYYIIYILGLGTIYSIIFIIYFHLFKRGKNIAYQFQCCLIKIYTPITIISQSLLGWIQCLNTAMVQEYNDIVAYSEV